MVSLLELPSNAPIEEKLVTLYGISWEQFKAIEAQLPDNREVRLTYLSGVMEITSPIGDEHEYVKSTLRMLLDAYMREKGIRFYKLGGFTLETIGSGSGTPDESYSIGSRKALPDIVIEVIFTSSTINRKDLYKPLQIPEIWFWESNQLRIFHLHDSEYQEVSCSIFLPDLDKSLLLQYLGHPDRDDAVNEFVEVIRNL